MRTGCNRFKASRPRLANTPRALARDTEVSSMPSDTSASARQVYLDRLAEMTPSERIEMGAALWEAGHHLQIAGLRQMHPDAEDAEITFRIAVTRFGAEIARKAYRRQ